MMKRKPKDIRDVEQIDTETLLKLRHLWSVALWYHEYTENISREPIQGESNGDLLVKMPQSMSRACITKIYKVAIENDQATLPSTFWKSICYYCLHFYTQFPYLQAVKSYSYKINGSRRVVDMDKVCSSMNPTSFSDSLLQIMNDSDLMYHIQCGQCKSEAIWRPGSNSDESRQEKRQKQISKSKDKRLADFLSLISTSENDLP